MMTGYSEADTAERLAGMGVADFLQKPFELGRLRDVVERATSG
jgi:DNA-binding NtrC family response regulator